eukprot:COSAG02_NODE_59576_length_274_cov_0.560000_1_plen_91_part_11
MSLPKVSGSNTAAQHPSGSCNLVHVLYLRSHRRKRAAPVSQAHIEGQRGAHRHTHTHRERERQTEKGRQPKVQAARGPERCRQRGAGTVLE